MALLDADAVRAAVDAEAASDAAFKARLGSNPVSAKVLRERKKAARKRLEAQEAEAL